MITKKELFNFINEYQTFNNAIDRISEAIYGSKYGCDLFESDWYNSVGLMFDMFISSHFTEEGSDLVSWWMFEDVDKIIYEEVDPDLFDNKTKVEYDVNTFDNLWNYMIKHEKDYFKNV